MFDDRLIHARAKVTPSRLIYTRMNVTPSDRREMKMGMKMKMLEVEDVEREVYKTEFGWPNWRETSN